MAIAIKKVKPMTQKKKNEKYTASEVADRFEEAVRTLKRLHVPGLKPQAYFSGWPDMVYTTWEILAQETLPMRLGSPPPDQISRMEEVLNWMWLIDSIEERQLIWLRARKVPWRPICAAMGYGRTKLWQDWTYALLKLANRLNNQQKSKKRK